jgi:hypothetical protein
MEPMDPETLKRWHDAGVRMRRQKHGRFYWLKDGAVILILAFIVIALWAIVIYGVGSGGV